MKKNIIIICTVLTSFALTAFAYMNSEISKEKTSFCKKPTPVEIDLLYKIGNRWNSTMTKENLKKATSINDIVSVEAIYNRYSFKNVTVSVLHNDKDVRDIESSEMGQTEVLSPAQINLINSSDYSTNIRITALSRLKDVYYEPLEYDSLVHYMTIIPEKEAEFEGGFNELTEYLKESSKEKTAIIKRGYVQPGQVFFTVTKNGAIANIKVVSTSGHTSVDEELVKNISNMPEKWTPAENSKGEKVDQEFVFFFGNMGC